MPNYPFDTPVLNGLVVTQGNIVRADIGIRGGKVIAPQIETMPRHVSPFCVNSGRISLPALIPALSETPAKTFGYACAKGRFKLAPISSYLIQRDRGSFRMPINIRGQVLLFLATDTSHIYDS